MRDIGNISQRGDNGQGTAQEEARRHAVENRQQEGKEKDSQASLTTSPMVPVTSKGHHFLKADQKLLPYILIQLSQQPPTF